MTYPFSNFYPYKKVFYDCGVILKTPEHYYQAEKTINHYDRLKVLCAETPGQAKRLGAKVKLRPDWEQVKFNVMVCAQELKVYSEHDYYQLVKNGTSEDFIEYNHWHDNEWGSCTCTKCADKPKKNLLQKVLLK